MSNGGKRKGAGRPKGSPNKATKKVRDAVASIVDDNIPKVQGWIDDLAEKDSEKAANLLIKLMEFTTPKLARKELTGSVETTSKLIIHE